MTPGEIAMLTIGTPVVMAVIGLLMKIANSTGRIEQKIDDHEGRIKSLERARGYPYRREQTT